MESIPSKYLLLTDGQQFHLPFWTKEAASLQRLMDKQRMRHPQTQIPDVPSPDDLQMQFIHWLVERPAIPMLAAPANSEFYDDLYYARFTPEPNTGFFDEEYVSGKRPSFIQPNRQFEALNPSLRASPTYQEACTAVLTTAEEIEHHETRIYQEVYNPTSIRANIAHML